VQLSNALYMKGIKDDLFHQCILVNVL
jgi:hypothetical protein